LFVVLHTLGAFYDFVVTVTFVTFTRSFYVAFTFVRLPPRLFRYTLRLRSSRSRYVFFAFCLLLLFTTLPTVHPVCLICYVVRCCCSVRYHHVYVYVCSHVYDFDSSAFTRFLVCVYDLLRLLDFVYVCYVVVRFRLFVTVVTLTRYVAVPLFVCVYVRYHVAFTWFFGSDSRSGSFTPHVCQLYVTVLVFVRFVVVRFCLRSRLRSLVLDTFSPHTFFRYRLRTVYVRSRCFVPPRLRYGLLRFTFVAACLFVLPFRGCVCSCSLCVPWFALWLLDCSHHVVVPFPFHGSLRFRLRFCVPLRVCVLFADVYALVRLVRWVRSVAVLPFGLLFTLVPVIVWSLFGSLWLPHAGCTVTLRCSRVFRSRSAGSLLFTFRITLRYVVPPRCLRYRCSVLIVPLFGLVWRLLFVTTFTRLLRFL